MSAPWPMVPLGEVLQLSIDAVPVDPSAMYPIAGVYSFGRGLLRRPPLSGSATTYRAFHRLHQDQFVISQLKAWEGALTRVPADFDGSFVSPQFATFEPNACRLDVRFLDWYCRQTQVWEQLRRAARGMGARRDSVPPKKFLQLVIPLPPLDEQQRIVARLEQVAAKIAEAHRLHEKASFQARGILLSEYGAITRGAAERPMAEVAPLVRRPVALDASAEYPELGIRSFGKGTFHKPAISGSALGTKRMFAIQPGDLLFNIVFAWEGAVAVARPEDIGRFGSHRFLTCVPREGIATASFLCFHFLTNRGLEQLGDASPGGAGRNRTLGVQALANIPVPVPPIEHQRRFDHLCEKMRMAAELRTGTDAELAALLPAILDKAFRGEL